MTTTGWVSGATGSRTSCHGRRRGLATFAPWNTRPDGGRSSGRFGGYKPAVVALVGVTLYRAILPLVVSPATAAGGRRDPRVRLGEQRVTIHGATVFVLPNPSGRNANFSYGEMLAAFRKLARYLRADVSDA